MATAAEQKQWRISVGPSTGQVLPDGPAPKKAASRGWRRRSRWQWLLAAVVVLLALVWLLPAIVAHSPMLNWIVGSLAADLRGKVTARSASLGWFSSLKLSGIEIRDEQDQPLVEIPEIQGDRSLLAILWNSSQLGRIRLQGPTLRVVVREDGSNVEDALASYLAPSDEPWEAVNVGVEIVDGKVSITDPRAQKTWQIEGLQLALAMSADAAGPLELKTSGTVADEPGTDRRLVAGRFAAALKMYQHVASDRTPSATAADGPQSDGREPSASDELTIQTDGVPLAAFESLLNRFALSLGLAGRLSSDIQCRWNRLQQDAPDTMLIQGSATANDLIMTAPSLGSDRVELRQVHLAGKVGWQEDRVQVEQLVVESDVGSASLAGSFDVDENTAARVLASLPKQTFEVNGQIDLARLAALLPATLRIREGTRVTSGQLQLALASRRNPEGMSWQARIGASNLAAVNQGRQLVWQQPILVTLAAHEGPQGPIVESLRCDSDFLKLHAAGTPEQLTGSASFDLNRLASQLGSFIDLGGVHASGDGWAQVNWQRSESQGFEADAELQVRNFELAMPDRPSWSEESLVVAVSATGRTNFSADTQVDTAALKLDAGPDRLEARLMQPVLDLRGGGVWPVEIHSTGELARWLPRIGPWVPLNDWSFAGAYQLVAQATGSATAVDVRQGRLTVEQLQLQAPGWHILEPQAELIVSGGWDHGRRRLELHSAALTSSSVSAQAANVVCTLPPEGPAELAGAVAYRGSLDRLRQWTIDAAEPPQWHVQGEFSGKADLRQSGGTTAATVETTIDDLIATHQSGRQFHEAQILLTGRGTYDADTRSIQLEQARLSCGTLGVQAAGRIALREDQADAQLAGQVDYDMQKISQLLSPYTGDGVRLAGRGARPVSYQGPFSLEAAQAEAAASWTSAEVYGFQAGPGELQVRLSGGMLQMQPLDLAVSEGRLRLASQLRLAPGPRELYVQPGRVADAVRINPRMCAHALQYIAPVLAGVATAEGRFSIELDGCRIPLSDPAQGELAGRMIIHSAQIGPGPLVQELAVVLGYTSAAQLARESVISFRMADGRVYHRDLELVFPDLTIRTYGSVGLDQSLAITAEMPIPPKWRAGHQVLDSALRDQRIRVPIGGTLTKPRIDRKVLDSLSQQFLENAARNVLEDGLNRGFERLFSPPR